MAITVLIADDHQIVRQGLRTLLEREPDLKVVAQSEDGRTTVRLARELAPEVIIMALKPPGKSSPRGPR
jgi:two-component system response regulator NreC